MQYLACRNSFDNVSVPIIQKTIATKRLEHLEKRWSWCVYFCCNHYFVDFKGTPCLFYQSLCSFDIVDLDSDYILSWKVQRFTCLS